MLGDCRNGPGELPGCLREGFSVTTTTPRTLCIDIGGTGIKGIVYDPNGAPLSERVRIAEGRGADVLPTLVDEAPFDLVFIDADKESNTVYLDWAARLGRPGTVVIVDNVVRSGEVANPASESLQVHGVRRGLEMLARDPRFDATALQTLDAKGWDGLALAMVV